MTLHLTGSARTQNLGPGALDGVLRILFLRMFIGVLVFFIFVAFIIFSFWF